MDGARALAGIRAAHAGRARAAGRAGRGGAKDTEGIGMITRREWLQRLAGAGGMLALDPRAVFAADAGKANLITRAIPSTGERLPIVGLGSSATFAQVARGEDVTALR